jgi:hypothetical protein
MPTPRAESSPNQLLMLILQLLHHCIILLCQSMTAMDDAMRRETPSTVHGAGRHRYSPLLRVM